ncbi:MAG: hypothetical protein II670_11625, partial [Alphaproteobacteria bacterium]|nr:hypothetical protein [Alphaproteobacteria bacterium]
GNNSAMRTDYSIFLNVNVFVLIIQYVCSPPKNTVFLHVKCFGRGDISRDTDVGIGTRGTQVGT